MALSNTGTEQGRSFPGQVSAPDEQAPFLLRAARTQFAKLLPLLLLLLMLILMLPLLLM